MSYTEDIYNHAVHRGPVQSYVVHRRPVQSCVVHRGTVHSCDLHRGLYNHILYTKDLYNHVLYTEDCTITWCTQKTLPDQKLVQRPSVLHYTHYSADFVKCNETWCCEALCSMVRCSIAVLYRAVFHIALWCSSVSASADLLKVKIFARANFLTENFEQRNWLKIP